MTIAVYSDYNSIGYYNGDVDDDGVDVAAVLFYFVCNVYKFS